MLTSRLEEWRQGQIPLDDLIAHIQAETAVEVGERDAKLTELLAFHKQHALPKPVYQALVSALLRRSSENEQVVDRTEISQVDSTKGQHMDDPHPDNTGSSTTVTQRPGGQSGPVKPASAASRPLGSGHVIKDRFELGRELGRGGMGVVYLALDRRRQEAGFPNPYVALKVLNEDYRYVPEAILALQREAMWGQALAHENILRVYDFDRDGGLVFMTMELVEGRTLKSVIREPGFTGLPWEHALPIIAGMAGALALAHRKGVIHADFKPSNVLLTPDGTAKLFDFGVARVLDHYSADSDNDGSFLSAFTPAYASLEMLEGQSADVRDDVYGLGCVVFELITGRHPYARKSAREATEQGLKPLPSSKLGPGRREVIERAVALQRDDRISDVEGFLEALLSSSRGLLSRLPLLGDRP
ncbi:MAG: serine/threonine-protein kinase [Pseudomonadota bacterium]|nr:serine/threonine-protein kinase [Pseudomonadota bacterium]